MWNKRRVMLALVIGGVGALASGCETPHLYSQPGRLSTLETAKNLKADEHSVGVYGGPSSTASLDFADITARYRQGLSDEFEVGVDGNLRVLTNMEKAATPTTPTVWGARLSGKWAPEALNDYMAVVGGVGGGTYVAGQFFSPDLGVILAYENPYVVPFAAGNGYMSVPIGAEEVDLSRDTPGEHMATPKTTWGMSGTLGIRVPIEAGRLTIAPSVGMAFHWLTDGDESTNANGANIGLDMIF